MRYLSWFEGWLGHLLPQRRPDGGVTHDTVIKCRLDELSSEDLFYVAMLRLHV